MESGYVHAETVINEAAERLGISNPEAYRLRFKKLLIDAEKKIGTIGTVGFKYYLYEVGSSQFPLGDRLLVPHDLIDNLTILDSSGCEIDSCSYNIQGNYIRFSPIRTTPIIIKYRGVLLDINGDALIPNNHFEASTCYLMYMYISTRYHTGKSPRYMYKDAQIEWRDRLGEARGNDLFPDEKGIIEAGQALYNARICKAGQKCCDACTSKNIGDLIDEYFTSNEDQDMLYGSIPLNVLVEEPFDLTDSLIGTLFSATKEEVEGDDFYNNVTDPSRTIFVVPKAFGEITKMYDSLQNNFFENYFNLIIDNERDYFIYVSKEFVNPYNYKLKIEF